MAPRGRPKGSRNKKKTLRQSNILVKKSATSQAYQIRALRNWVSRLARKSKPNICTLFQESTTQFVFANNLSFNWGNVCKLISPILPTHEVESPLEGINQDVALGNWIRLHNLTLFCNCTYERSYPEFNSAGETSPIVDSYGLASYRIVAFQAKTSGQAFLLTTDFAGSNIIQNAATTGYNYHMNTLLPLKEGIASQYHILYDKRFILTKNKTQGFHRIRIRPKIRIASWKPNDYTTQPKGAIYILIITSGLDVDPQWTERLRFSFNQKLAWSNP